jgi:hypothetical protein
MADPVDRKPHDAPRNGRLAHDAPRKGAFPLIWLLVLAALLAFGWSFYNHHASRTSPAPTVPPTASPHAGNPPKPA